MTQFSDDFSSQTVGSSPPTGWTSRWVTTAETMSVASLAGTPSSKGMAHSSTASNRYVWSLDSASNTYTGDFDAVMLWRSSDTANGNIYARIMTNINGGSTSTTENGYACDMTFGTTSGTMRVQRYNSGTASTIATTSITQPTSNQWTWFRFTRVGNNFYTRVWADGVTEPTAWTINFTDASPYSTAGYYGVGFYNYQNSNISNVAFFGIGQGVGVSAPLASVTKLDLGATAITNLKLGSNDVKRVFVGNTLVYYRV